MPASNKSLTAIQKKIYYSSTRDGIRELYQAGLLFLATFLFINIYTQYIISLLIVLSVLLWRKIHPKIKESIIFPRIGVVNFHPDHERQIMKYKRMLIITFIFAYILFFVIIVLQSLTVAITIKYLPIFIGGVVFARLSYDYFLTGIKTFSLLGFISWIIVPFLYIVSFPQTFFYPMLYCAFQFLLNLILGIYKWRKFIRENNFIVDDSKDDC